MADEKFKKWSDRYKKGEIKTATMPPLPAGPAGLGRQAVGSVVGTGLRALRDAYTKSQKNASRNAKRRESAAEKKAARSKEKFGALVKREDKMPATQGSRALVKREDKLPATQGSRALTVAREGKGDLQKYNPGGRSVATQGTRTFGDKGQSGRIVGLSPKGKLALGAGAAAAVGATAYKKAGGADASSKLADGARDSGRRVIYDEPIGPKAPTPRDDRASSGGSTAKAEDKKKKNVGPINRDNLGDKGKKVFDGRQGQAKSKDKKPSSPVAGKQSSGRSSGKASPFERQKQRMYEKEGYGGRSMTSSKAKERVKEERGYKFKDLFKKK